jgi:hypothetical protein
LLCKRKVQRIERTESESGKLASALCYRIARHNKMIDRFEPEARR